MAGLFDRLFGGDDNERVIFRADPPPDGQIPSDPSPPIPAPGGKTLSAPEIAAKIAQLMQAGADPDLIAETYAGFERAYPLASLPGEWQGRVASLLDQEHCRLLAIEAYRKAIQNPGDPGRQEEATLALARLLGESPATQGEALKLLGRLRAATHDSALIEQCAALEGRIRSILEEIYPIGPDGRPAAAPDGPCRILAQTLSKLNIPEVGALIAHDLGRRRAEVNIELKRVPGVIARNIPAPQAEHLAHAIQAIGTPVVIVPEDHCPPLPEPEMAREVRAGEGETFILDLEGGSLALSPDDLSHAVFGLLRSVKSVATKPYSAWVQHGGHNQGRTPAPRPLRGSMSQRTDLTPVCDLYLFEPMRRLRLVQGTTATRRLLPPNWKTTMEAHSFVAVLKRILHRASRVPLNYTLDILFADSVPDPVVCDSKQTFENRSEWLFLLACNGAMAE